AFYLHATLLRQAFAHCGKFPTAASRRSLGRVSVPVWLIILSDQLLIIALFAPRNIAIPTPSRQSHEPLIHSHSITAGEQVKIEKLTLGLGIIRLELMTSTTSRQRVEKLNATILEQLGVGPSFCTITDTKIMGKIRFNCQLFLSKIGSTTDSSHSTWFHKTVQFSRSK
ncbi:hypothetical protein G4B88_025799, partial [Cannabis sativa]